MLPKSRLEEIRNQIPQLEATLSELKATLQRAEQQCKHKWGSTTKTVVPEIAYRNGPMVKHGVDIWYEPVPYTRNTTAWTRTCSICGKVDKTTTTRQAIIDVPSFND